MLHVAWLHGWRGKCLADLRPQSRAPAAWLTGGLSRGPLPPGWLAASVEGPCRLADWRPQSRAPAAWLTNGLGWPGCLADKWQMWSLSDGWPEVDGCQTPVLADCQTDGLKWPVWLANERPEVAGYPEYPWPSSKLADWLTDGLKCPGWLADG